MHGGSSGRGLREHSTRQSGVCSVGGRGERCEFSLIRYVPDPVKNEFVNIGVLLRRRGRAARRCALRATGAACAAWIPTPIRAMLEALEAEIGGGWRRMRGAGVRSLEDALSNAVQMTEAKACLAESFATELEGLMQLYVETAKRRRESRRTGARRLQARMRTEFERAGVWELMQQRHQCGAGTRGRAIRCASIAGIGRMAWCGCFRRCRWRAMWRGRRCWRFLSADLTEGVARVENATLELTAIVEPLRDAAAEDVKRSRLSYRFGGGDDGAGADPGVDDVATWGAWRRRRGGSCGCKRTASQQRVSEQSLDAGMARIWRKGEAMASSFFFAAKRTGLRERGADECASEYA